MPNSNNAIIKKAKQEKFNYLNSLQYSVLIKRKKGKFCLIISELSLIAVDDNLEAAYKDLSEKKEKLFNDLLEQEAEDTIRLPRETQQRHEMLNQLKIFVCKLLITCLIGGIIFGFIAGEMINKIADRIPSVGTVKQIARKVIFEAENFAKAPDYVNQKRLEKLRNILKGLSPFIREFQAAFKNSPEQKE